MNFRLNLRCFIYGLLFVFLSLSPIYGNSLRLATYNILSDDYLWEGIYDYVSPEILCWNTRKINLLKRINKLEADVICLQELNVEAFEYFKASLIGFEGCFVKKKCSNMGVGTFYRKEVFANVNNKQLFFENKDGISFSVQPTLITTLEFGDEQTLTIVNSKFKWCKDLKPGDAVWNFVIYLMKIVKKERTLIVGDFNLRPDHPILTKFKVANFYDLYEDFDIYTNYANLDFQRIDYILVSKDIKLAVIPELKNVVRCPIPNFSEPSDHLPVTCVISYE